MDRKREEEAAKHAEQFESIPWSSLEPHTRSRLARIAMIGAMVVAGVVIGLIGGRVLRGAAQPGVVVTLPPVAAPDAAPAPGPTGAPETTVAPATEPAAPAPPGTAPTSDQGPPAPAPAPPQLYSEADLMAVLPEEEMRAAVMRAEWFVTDFFTVDHRSTTVGDIVAALPDGHAAAPLPHESADAGVSHVEWARAYRVEPLGPGGYRVSVAYRTLAGRAVGDLVRSPVRAVTVDVEVGPDAATAVLDFPAPAPAPATLSLTAVDLPEMEAPPDVTGSALQAAAAVGTDPAFLLAGLTDDGWRVVVLVGNESGLRWPLAVVP